MTTNTIYDANVESQVFTYNGGWLTKVNASDNTIIAKGATLAAPTEAIVNKIFNKELFNVEYKDCSSIYVNKKHPEIYAHVQYNVYEDVSEVNLCISQKTALTVHSFGVIGVSYVPALLNKIALVLEIQ